MDFRRLAAPPLLICLGVLLSAGPSLPAAVVVLPEDEEQVVFAGAAEVRVTLRNDAALAARPAIRGRVFLLGTSLAAPAGAATMTPEETDVPPGATLVARATLELPEVRVPSRFRVDWTDATGSPLGRSEVVAVPRDALKRIAEIAGDKPVAVGEDASALRAALTAAGATCVALEAEREAAVAVFGPFARRGEMPAGLREQIRARGKRGAASVVLLERAAAGATHLAAERAVVLAMRGWSGIAASARHQLALVRAVELAGTDGGDAGIDLPP